MILLFPSKGSITEGQALPLIQVPLNAIKGGEDVELNDFQWWAKTSEWQEWLKSNPRSWQAESENFDDYPHHSDFRRLSNYSDFKKLLESEEIYEADDSTESTPEQTTAMLKFIQAKENLSKAGKIDLSVDFATVKDGEELAWFLSHTGSDGSDISNSEMAYKISKKYASTGQFSIYELTEIQPIGIKVDDGTLLQQIYEQTLKWAKIASVGAATIFGGYIAIKSVGGLINLVKLNSRVAKLGTKTKYTRKLINVKNFLKTGASSAFKGLKNTGKLIGGLVKGVGTGGKWARQAFKFSKAAGAGTSKAVSRGVSAFARGFGKSASKALPKTLGEAIPVVGWVIAIGDVAQQTYNWFSGNQAPRFGEVDTFAKDVFEPGKIAPGEIITVCWTQEGSNSNSWVGFLPMSADDTRTTMDLAKVGNFSGSSLFILLNIGSKGMGTEFAKNDVTFILFPESSKFETGVLDNDDLSFKVVGVQNAKESAMSMFFHGTCPWGEFLSSYDGASAALVNIDPGAPADFKFNFLTETTRVNVKGTLVDPDFVDLQNPDSGLNKMVGKAFDETSPEIDSDQSGEETEEEVSDSLKYSGKVLSFNEFNNPIFEATEEKESMDIELTPENVAIYRVVEINNADENAKTETPKFEYFVIPAEPSTYNASEGSEIDVASDEISLEDTRMGFAPIIPAVEKTDTEQEEVEVDAAPSFEDTPEVEEVTSTIVVPEDEVKFKYKEDKEKIKDIKRGGFNLLKSLTTEEERDELGIGKWNELDVIKVKGNVEDNKPRMIKLREKGEGGTLIPDGEKLKFTPADGNKYDLALSIFNRMKDRVKNQ
jgi:hypothetical protein